VSDHPDDQDGAAEAATEQPLTAWPEPAEGAAWVEIEDRAESAVPGPAGPGTSPEEAPTEVQPATEAGRSRRPTSLRDLYVQPDDSVPRRKLEPPAFPSAPAIPGSRTVGSPVDPPVSETEQAGEPGQISNPGETDDPGQTNNPGQTHDPGPSFKEKLPLDKLSLNKLPLNKLPLGKLSRDKLPTGKLSSEKLPVDKLRTLTKQRPEVGLGLAFAGGLVIATIVKRLGRR
jgi:hypothetical protein